MTRVFSERLLYQAGLSGHRTGAGRGRRGCLPGGVCGAVGLLIMGFLF